MKREIERIPVSQMDSERFEKAFLLPEIPVILTGIETENKDEITASYVHEHFGEDAHRNIGWYDAPLKSTERRIPKIVSEVFDRDDISVREQPVRIFMQPGSHKTLFHYDGNSLHVFNLTIKGRKRWVLVSPDTPLPFPPFMFISLVRKEFEPDPREHDFYDFELGEGEMLFLPRYWIHAVETLAEENINYNWVCTPTFPNHHVKSGRRESELLYVRKKLPWIDRFLVDNYDSYGGRGKEITERYIDGLGINTLFARLAKEMVMIPRTLMLFSEVRSMAEAFKRNNFNLDKGHPSS